jgi:Tfp pilus assembly protein PilN
MQKHANVLVAALLLVLGCTLPGPASSRRSHQRDDYLSRAQSELNQFDQRINDLKEKANQEQGKAKAELNAEIDQLRRKQATAQQRIAEVQAASEGAWQTLQAGADSAINDLKKAYDQATARLHGTR